MSDKSDPPWWVDTIARTDLFIMVRVFVRPVWWVDRRWHVNQFDQAAAVLTAAIAMCFGDNAMNLFTKQWGIALMGVVSAGVLAWMYARHLRHLQKASQAYERDPTQITMEQTFYEWVSVPPLRLLLLLCGVQIWLMFIIPWHGDARHVARDVLDLWMLLIGSAFYIAGVPRTPFGRDKKKARALTPAPVPAPAPL
jgi:cbb3-type cytochrome oxidase subunit 3